MNVFWDILAGGGILGGVVAVRSILTHKKPPVVQGAQDVAASVSAQVSDAIGEAMKGVPELVSEEVASLKAALTAMEQRAQAAEAKWLAEHQASALRLDAVKAQLIGFLTNVGDQSAEAIAALPADFTTLERRFQQMITDALNDLKTAADAKEAKAVADAVATAVQPAVDAAKAEDEQAVRDFTAANFPAA